MGYRVGSQCFSSTEQAHDYLLSQLLPTVTADGQLIKPIKNGQNWELNGQKIQLSFPECDIGEQIQFGAYVAAPLLVLAAMIFGFRSIKKLLESMGKFEDGNDG